MKKIILFTTSWPIKKALRILYKHDDCIVDVYQNECALLCELSKEPSATVIIDLPPHRKILLMTAINATSVNRKIIFIWKEICFSDKVLARLIANGCAYSYSEFYESKFKKIASDLYTKSSEHVITNEFLLGGLCSPKMMTLNNEKNKIYEMAQKNIYQELFMLGSTINEVSTIRLLRSGLSITKIADILGCQLKTIYTYKANIASKANLGIPIKKNLNCLIVNQKNQDDVFFARIYKENCSKDNFSCENCPLNDFCFKKK